MAFQTRISTLDGANQFWERYGITISGGGSLHSKALTKMWEKLGDLYVRVP